MASSNRHNGSRDPSPGSILSQAGVEVALGSLLAGTRNQGIADGIEMLGFGAVLIDPAGRVLHVGPRGRRLMAGWLRIVAEHLVAERPSDDGPVATLVGTAVAGRPSPSGVRLRAGLDDPVLSLRALIVPQPDGTGPGPHAAIVLDEL